MLKKFSKITLSVILLSLIIFNYLQNQVQANTTLVTVTDTRNPGYQWCQHSNGEWSTYSVPDGYVRVANDGGEPIKTWVTTTTSISTPTSNWKTQAGASVNYSEVKNIKIVDVRMDTSRADPNIQGSPSVSSDGSSVIIKGWSGKGIRGEPGSNCGTNPNMNYAYPIIVTWEGVIDTPEVTLEIDPSEYTLEPGQTGQFRVYARWSDRPTQRYLVDNSRLVWSSAKSSHVTVNSNGLATGVQNTTAVNITAYMPEYNASVTGRVTVSSGAPPPPSHPYWLEITPPSQTVEVGETATYRAILHHLGTQTDVSNRLITRWSIRDEHIAWHDRYLVQGLQEGQTKIIAQYNHFGDDLYAEADVIVKPQPRIVITPNPETIRIGEQQTFRAVLIVGSQETDITELQGTNWFMQNTFFAVNLRNTVTGIRKGQATLMATYNYQGRLITGQATINVIPIPATLTIRPDERTVYIGDTTSYRAFLEVEGQEELDVTENSTWWLYDSDIALPDFNNKGDYIGRARGSTNIVVQHFFQNLLYEAEATLNVIARPPIVSINAPAEVIAGTNFCIESNVISPNGDIVEYNWNYDGEGTLAGEESCNLYYMEVGEQEVTLQVTDEIGEQSNIARATINVIEPIPNAEITIPQDNNSRKENRRIDIKSSFDTPQHFPIDWSKSYLQITPVNAAQLNSIRYRGMDLSHNQSNSYKIPFNENWEDISFNITNVGVQEISYDIHSLFKEQGNYLLTLYVENAAGHSATATGTLEVLEDLQPIADFSVIPNVFREASNNNQARITATDRSSSIDNDVIQQRIWSYRYDSNNDGNFGDEEWIAINGDNLSSISVNVPRVGYYEVRLEVVEYFGQPTIEEFITSSDFRRGNTDQKTLSEKIIRVGNRAPSVQWGM